MSKSYSPLFFEHDESLPKFLINKKLRGRDPASPVLVYQYLEASAPQGSGQPLISVVNEDCLAEAQKQLETHPQVCVLNLANQYLVGGDYLLGRGQEESLIRRTDLLESLVQMEGVKAGDLCNHYKYQLPDSLGFDRSTPQGFGEFTALYSKDVAVRRLESEEQQSVAKPFNINVISSSAYNIAANENLDPLLYLPGTVFKILNQLRTAKAHQQRHLILGAFGCGAFHNKPELIADIYNAAIAEYEFQGCFDTIQFAITTALLHTNNPTLDAFQKQLLFKPKPLREILKECIEEEEKSPLSHPQLSKMLAPFMIIESRDKLSYLVLQMISCELETLDKLSQKASAKKEFVKHLRALITSDPEDSKAILLRELQSSACQALTPTAGLFQGVPYSFVSKLTKLVERGIGYFPLAKNLYSIEEEKGKSFN